MHVMLPKVCYMHNVMFKPTNQHGGRTLGPSANNFEGSDLNNLIAVPTTVCMAAAGIVGRGSGESSGCYPKLCCDSRKTHRGFALKAPIMSGRLVSTIIHQCVSYG